MFPSFRINTVAGLLGKSPATIRFYERQGRIPRATRNQAGQRVYSLVDLLRIAQLLYPGIDMPSLLQPGLPHAS